MLSFHIKFVQTDQWTKVKQYAPNLSMQGHKNQTWLKQLNLPLKEKKKFHGKKKEKMLDTITFSFSQEPSSSGLLEIMIVW